MVERQATGEARGDATLRLVGRHRDPEDQPAWVEGGSPLVMAAREEVRRRGDRRLVLGPDLLAEPAWDMLLDLYLAREAGHRVAVSSLCIAAGIPTTTALRWIRLLEAEGLVSRERDRDDGRRSFVDLTASARDKLELLLRRSISRRGSD